MQRDGRLALYSGCGIAALLFCGFGILAYEVLKGDTLSLDKAVLMLFRDPAAPAVPLGPPWLVEAARDITALGSFSVLGLLVIAVVLHLALTGAWRRVLLILVTVIGGTIISNTLKDWFNRPRPDLTGAVEVFTASFPSGHATISAVFYLTIGVLLAHRETRWPPRILYLAGAVFFTGIIGFSRVYLGVHYPTDVIAGWSLGTAWALLCLTLAGLFRSRGRPHEQGDNAKL